MARLHWYWDRTLGATYCADTLIVAAGHNGNREVKMTESTHLLKKLVEVSGRLKKAKFFDVAISLDRLNDDDMQELDEAVTLVRNFIGNLERFAK